MPRLLRPAADSAARQKLSLYIHVPFCASKCSYCDFSSFAGLEHLIPNYCEALACEAALWSRHASTYAVSSVYFGGGTPSILEAGQIGGLLEALRRSFGVADDAEITLEANPNSAGDEFLQQLHRLGINRLSLGVQDLDETVLTRLGRRHTATEALESYAGARTAGFDNINLDLIYGLPGQSLAEWRDTLERTAALRPEHLSLYALTLEPHVPLAQAIRSGAVPAPDPDLAADMYELAQGLLASEGYEHYEISNWALPGWECRHNITYWTLGAYVGLGAAAHSYFLSHRFANTTSPERYVEYLQSRRTKLPPGLTEQGPWQALAAEGWPVETLERVSPQREMSDFVILGLRLVRGISLDEFAERFGAPLESLFDREAGELAGLGLLETTGRRLRLTPRGRLLSNEVFVRFLQPGDGRLTNQSRQL